MKYHVQKIIVLGGGSAGLLAALTIRSRLPQVEVTLIRSQKIPVIGVGESTTRALPHYLHNVLGLDRSEFYQQVRPSWKLGIRFEWGSPDTSHFNYPFADRLDVRLRELPQLIAFYCADDQRDTSVFDVLMDRGLSPCALRDGQYGVDESGAYHIENKSFVAFLEVQAKRAGVRFVDGDVAAVPRTESGDVEKLELEDGRNLAADLFVDCSGFRSVLMGKTLGERFVSYDDSLFCDRAVVGNWQRDDAVMPYTTVETMDSGWCWKIEFIDHMNRGYVYSSAFCSDDDAMREMKQKNPRLGDDLRVIKFPCGRYENFWVGNVAAIGNAAGFVEPLESSALQHIIEQSRFLCTALCETNCRVTPQLQELENRRFRWLWDDLRDFLAVHYKFNRRLDTPFWRHCREHVDLGGAEQLVDYYRRVGPTSLASSLIYPASIFGYEGYLSLLMGQQVPTDFCYVPSDGERETWQRFRDYVRSLATGALPVREAMQLVCDPSWTWPSQRS
jgi:tryptophan halogenase